MGDSGDVSEIEEEASQFLNLSDVKYSVVKKDATRDRVVPIDLIDGNEFAEILKSLQVTEQDNIDEVLIIDLCIKQVYYA